MMGRSVAKGCGSIMSAYSTGRGIAFALGLEIFAEVKAERMNTEGQEFRSNDINLVNAQHPDLKVKFGINVLTNLLHKRNIRGYKVDARTWGDLPPASGLKSSSAAGNALILAASQCFGINVSNKEIIELNTQSAIESGVTTAGSLDDAYASLLGGVVFTDYNSRELVHRITLDDGLMVVVLSPERPIKDHLKVDRKSFTPYSKVFDTLFDLSRTQGAEMLYATKVVNGLVHEAALGHDTAIIDSALRSGAVAAGLSGKGPSFTALVPPPSVKNVINSWSNFPGKIFQTAIDNKGSHTLG